MPIKQICRDPVQTISENSLSCHNLALSGLADQGDSTPKKVFFLQCELLEDSILLIIQELPSARLQLALKTI